MTGTVGRLSAALAGRYTIERELGMGGMATVYLAHDLKHDRLVALKVLRPDLAAILGAERFLAEIKTTAHLQHPHILSLFDSGEADGLVFYVMPFVEGETLRDRLARERQLPVEEALRIASEVADALAHAHQHGIVHRDIKPENVLLHGGHALVADFGIALAASRSEGGTRLTETGMSLGTPAYMAPEQAMGEKDITRRADVYALGAVLYEMLSGEPPFVGPTAQAIIARVLTEEPRSLTVQRQTIPPHVEAAVRKALQKLPADRFETAAEFAEALAKPTAAAVAWTGPAPARAGLRWRAGWSVTASGVVAALALGFVVGGLWHGRAVPDTMARFEIGEELTSVLASGRARAVAVSPDGRTVAFIGRDRTGTHVYVRALADSLPRQLPGTAGARAPFFSPNGREIGFARTPALLERVPIEGGPPTVITDGASQYAAWLPNGGVVFAGLGTELGGRDLELLTADGRRRVVARSDSLQFLNLKPLPDGQHVLAAVSVARSGAAVASSRRITVVAVSLSDGTLHDVGLPDAVMAAYAGGALLYQRARGGPVMAAPFDLERLRVRSLGLPVAPEPSIDLRVAPQWDAAGPVLAYLAVEPQQLVLVDRAGHETMLEGEPRAFHHPRFSPDGRRVVVDISEGGQRDLWVAHLSDGRMTRLTVGEVANDAYWSSDGRRLAYTAMRGNARVVFLRNADGSGASDSLYADANDHSSGVWTRDGRALLVSTGLTAGLWIVPLTGSARPAPLAGSQPTEHSPALSADGRWLAYVSDESGRPEVYVRPFPGPGGRVQISVDGGIEPAWARAGREILYREQTGTTSRMIAAAVRLSGEPQVMSRTALFGDADYASALDHANYDVTSDGDRFVFIRSPRASRIKLILNWMVQLRER